MKEYHDGKVKLFIGDCYELLDNLEENSIDSVCCDPPYHLTSIVKRFGKEGSAPAKYGTDGVYARSSRGFMSKQWDGGDIAFNPELWSKVYRVLKPGGHMVAFGGTRTYHRMAVAIEDAGFEIRDMVNWVYGSGFPKSHDISKAIDRMNGMERKKVRITNVRNPKTTGGGKDGMEGATRPFIEKGIKLGYHEVDGHIPVSEEAKYWEGWGTALKPSQEPVCLARKPLSEPTIAANVLKWGTGALNIDGCRIGDRESTVTISTGEIVSQNVAMSGPNYGRIKSDCVKTGRWPANTITDGSDEVLALFPDSKGWSGQNHNNFNPYGGNALNKSATTREGYHEGFSDEGSAARFFYSAKAGPLDRIGSKHPTIKPVSLLQFLVRLVTPPNGTVLDMFAGTGTTGQAAMLEGFKSVLIEREVEYVEDIERRMKLVFEKTPLKREKGSTDGATLF